jgi:SpoVK/Ycf46/Vps4 family AAA+-type ATPase
MIQEDSVSFASTNFPENLDAALRRPGRFDVDLKFDFATHEQAMAMYRHFYAPITPEPSNTGYSIPSSTSSDTDKSQVDDDAERFADTIKRADIKVSIATIQGFLLLYKREPELVQEKVVEWAEGIRQEQQPDVEIITVLDTAVRGTGNTDVMEDKQVVEVGQVEAQEIKEKRKLKKKEGEKQNQEIVLA